MTHNSPETHVGIHIRLDHSLGRRICRGIINYAREHGNWRIFPYDPRDQSRRLFEGAQRKGAIMHLTGAIHSEHPPGLTTVNVGARNVSLPIPSVHIDNRAVGRLVGRHFLERGFTSLAFIGYENADFSHLRREGFCEVAGEQGIQPARLLLASLGGWSPDSLATMVSWLRELPKPVGLMVVQDLLALPLLRTCVDAGLAVPGEVAIVSVDSDDVLCELAEVPLSSVSPPLELQGYQAAALLDRLMNGEVPPTKPLLIDPGVVETRASSDVLANADPVVKRAVSLIHSKDGAPLTVRSLATAVNASRRYLERHFRMALGRTPHEEIARVRLDRVRHLLLQSDLSLAEVAAESGFRETKTMSIALRRAEGMTPGEYRRKHRDAPDRASATPNPPVAQSPQPPDASAPQPPPRPTAKPRRAKAATPKARKPRKTARR
jgi:LacI family transcriptional regulator